MKEANERVRAEIDDAGLKYWQVAAQVGVHPTTFTVWLRTPLEDKKEQQIRKAINELTLKVSNA